MVTSAQPHFHLPPIYPPQRTQVPLLSSLTYRVNEQNPTYNERPIIIVQAAPSKMSLVDVSEEFSILIKLCTNTDLRLTMPTSSV